MSRCALSLARGWPGSGLGPGLDVVPSTPAFVREIHTTVLQPLEKATENAAEGLASRTFGQTAEATHGLLAADPRVSGLLQCPIEADDLERGCDSSVAPPLQVEVESLPGAVFILLPRRSRADLVVVGRGDLLDPRIAGDQGQDRRLEHMPTDGHGQLDQGLGHGRISQVGLRNFNRNLTHVAGTPFTPWIATGTVPLLIARTYPFTTAKLQSKGKSSKELSNIPASYSFVNRNPKIEYQKTSPFSEVFLWKIIYFPNF